jgi:hypothetical protein
MLHRDRKSKVRLEIAKLQLALETDLHSNSQPL